MTVMEAIAKRRSIRNYKPDALPQNVVADIKEAYRLAPSASNLQEYKFYFITNSEVIKKVREDACNQDFIATAPLLVLCTCKKGGDFNVALAVENMVLAAAEHGVGSCIVAWFDKDKARAVIDSNPNDTVSILVTFGYPNEEPEPKVRKTLEELIVEI